jgi:hypothetical protein
MYRDGVAFYESFPVPVASLGTARRPVSETEVYDGSSLFRGTVGFSSARAQDGLSIGFQEDAAISTDQ